MECELNDKEEYYIKLFDCFRMIKRKENFKLMRIKRRESPEWNSDESKKKRSDTARKSEQTKREIRQERLTMIF